MDLSHRQEWVSCPQTPPAWWAGRDRWILAVKRHRRWSSLTHHTAADVGWNFLAKDWHHWYWCGGGEPVGLVIATGVVAGSFVAIGKRHSGENREARTSLTYGERGDIQEVNSFLFVVYVCFYNESTMWITNLPRSWVWAFSCPSKYTKL